ncbi:2-aminoadipate transaminase [Drosophila grimshawi]|uniref:GH16576 n=1 Tax=Drosophila grimshawi TaxID=7222 RepID=B4J1Q3_DROGR|nr:2-aminoadipate transaminase [Drosophila grimshawi]EDV96973.1 GH16576 [Drosophila grimshawi]
MSQKNEELKLKHLFDGGAWNVYEPDILNLGVGAPGTDLLEPCCDIFQQATAHKMKDEKQNKSLLFQYGPTSGCYEVRNEIAKYFSKMYNNPVSSEDLIITTGATQGLHFVLSTLIDFNGYIFVDEFTYMIALDSMKHFTSLQIVPLKLNEDGVDLNDLEVKVSERQFKSESKEFWAIYYTIPTYHNPTGILFSPTVCRGIVQLARKFDFLVLCDDVYNILHYGEKPLLSRLFAYDEQTDADYVGNVISNGSFSKIIGPGVRLGWLEVPPRIKPQLDRSGIINSGGCFNNYTSGILGSLFELQLAQPHIERLHTAYQERMLATTAVLETDLPESCHFLTPTGGYFIWIRLPDQLDARDFLAYSLQHEKISFIAGTRFAVEEGKGKQFFRLSIAFHDKAKLADGTRRLCLALRTFMKK